MQKTKDLFDKWAVTGSDKRAESEHFFAVKSVLDSLNWRSADSYLDIGCGNGYTLRYVSGKALDGRFLGIDFSEKMLANARAASAELRNAEFILADFTKWEPEGRTFDKIFSMEAFYYFADVAKAIKKAYSLLNPGGVFACVVDFYSENLASADWPLPCNCNVPMQRHSIKEWAEFFGAAGFSKVTQRQIRYPKELAKEDWQVKVGSLATIGEK